MKQKPLSIIQITDSHLFSNSNGKLLGMNTLDSLKYVVERIEEEQFNIDLIIATGDIAQEPTVESYQFFKQQVSRLGAPVYWVKGNHDALKPMGEALGTYDKISPVSVEIGNWRIIMLDSSVENEVPGYLAESQLNYLEKDLILSKGKNVFLTFHHAPVSMNSQWLDEHIIANANELFAITDKFDHIKVIVWGHVHQERDFMRKGVRLLSTPSCCVQFKPGSEEFCIDNLPPGYRWFECYEDGNINTGVSRVEEISFQADYSIKGY